jgi:putative ABC transport system ATP-binding protein
VSSTLNGSSPAGSSRRRITVLDGSGVAVTAGAYPAPHGRCHLQGHARRGTAVGVPQIEVREVSRLYHRGVDLVHALERVSLGIPAGRFVALMGPSGSGKSTLLNLLAGLDQPDSGEVVVAGTHLSRLSEDELAAWRARHVGLVFQFFNLLPVLSAVENVELPLLLTKLSRVERRRRAETALSVVGLAARVHHRPAQLSGGEQQRVAIARAIVTDPDLIVADEPTGDLDAKSAVEVLTLLRELNRAFEKTIVMVTHDPRAERFVDTVIRLDKGVLANGSAPTGSGA